MERSMNEATPTKPTDMEAVCMRVFQSCLREIKFVVQEFVRYVVNPTCPLLRPIACASSGLECGGKVRPRQFDLLFPDQMYPVDKGSS